VIESERLPRHTTYHYYRCKEVFASLLVWLRQKGVTSLKPYHDLRKLFGSLIAEGNGLQELTCYN
jgi:hypothetical protein